MFAKLENVSNNIRDANIPFFNGFEREPYVLDTRKTYKSGSKNFIVFRGCKFCILSNYKFICIRQKLASCETECFLLARLLGIIICEIIARLNAVIRIVL